MKVRVGPWIYDYDFNCEHMAQEGLMGGTDSEQLKVTVKATLTDEQKAEVSLHETMHAVADYTGCVPEIEAEEERAIRGLSSGLWLVLKTNKEYRDYLFKELEKAE